MRGCSIVKTESLFHEGEDWNMSLEEAEELDRYVEVNIWKIGVRSNI